MDVNEKDPVPQTRTDRLESWKEIAAYLKRDVRTVQRWEKREGLPVHRLVHDKLGTIYAFKSEIDAWWQSRSMAPSELSADLEPDECIDTVRETEEVFPPVTAQIRRPASFPRWLQIGALLFALAAVVSALLFWRPPAHFSVAVLPFTDLSRDAAQEYFVDGITEELTTQLGRIDNARLRVIAPQSAMIYKNSTKSLKQIASELHVDYLVQGTVRRSGDRVRVTAHLIRARNETQEWDNSYDRDLRDVIGLQVDVAQAIAAEVGAKLKNAKAVLAPVNPQAYEDYLKGRFFWNKRTPEDLGRAIAYFQQAISLDANYAPAYVGIADCYALLGSAEMGALAPNDAFPTARQAALKALSLDPTLAEAHAALAYIRLVYEWNFPGAEQEFHRAIELNPGYPTAHQWYALYLNAMGRSQEAIEEINKAQQLDPLSPTISTALAEAYYFSHDFKNAIAESQKALELSPDFILAYFNMGRAYEALGQYDQAISAFERARALSGNAPAVTALLAHVYASRGDAVRARQLLAEINLLRRNPRVYVSSLYLAAIYAALHEPDETFKALHSAVYERCEYLIYLDREPMADNFRSDPRFREIHQLVGLPGTK